MSQIFTSLLRTAYHTLQMWVKVSHTSPVLLVFSWAPCDHDGCISIYHVPSLEASLIRMALLLYPVHTSITSPRVSALSHMWLIFLFWWSSYFEEVTIKQVNNSSTSIYFLQSSFCCDFREDKTQNRSKVAGKSLNKWRWRTEGNPCKLNFLWW